MATRIIRLAQAPELFRLRLGDMVAARDSEGDADLEYTGTVVDGTREENPDTGAYEIVYRVKRADRQYFDARDLNLIRLYDDATLREEIRHRLATYRLHRSLPPAPEGDLEGHETIREGGRGQRCSACDHLIPGSDTRPMELRYPGGIVYLHARCYSVWLEERGRRS
jgi:hypothetical protein